MSKFVNECCLFLCQRRLHSLEAEVEQDQRLSLQLELLKKEKARLLSKLTAQESVLGGLKEERKIWGQELAQQGVRQGGVIQCYTICTARLNLSV